MEIFIESQAILSWKVSKHHQVQLLSPHGITQKSSPISEGIVQTLLEPRQAWYHDHFLEALCFCWQSKRGPISLWYQLCFASCSLSPKSTNWAASRTDLRQLSSSWRKHQLQPLLRTALLPQTDIISSIDGFQISTYSICLYGNHKQKR